MKYDEISHDLEISIAELENESRLNWSGLKNKPNTEAVMKKYDHLYSDKTVTFLRELWDREEDILKKKEYKLVYFALNNLNIYKKLAKISDHINSYFATSKIEFEGKDIVYYNIRSAIMREDDFDKREVLQSKSGAVVAGINETILESLQSEVRDLKLAGYAGYIDYFQREKDISYQEFFLLCKKIKDDLNQLYEEKMTTLIEDKIKKPWENLRSCHTLYLMQSNDFDSFFSKDKLITAYKETLKDIGLDDEMSNKINIDFENRPSKNPRAVCFTIRVPEEVYLIIKPNGTQEDFESFMHEAGHCLNYSHINKNLPFAFRNLSSSHALTELFSYTFESLARNPLWLEKYLGIPSKIGKKILFKTELINLFMLMRYLGKFSYEYELFSDDEAIRDNGPTLYLKNLGNFTNFVYDPVQYLNDMDSGFYSADYLRAWIAEAQMLEYLKNNFGINWFENKDAGLFFKSLWKSGFSEELEEILEENHISKPFDINPLIDKFFVNLNV